MTEFSNGGESGRIRLVGDAIDEPRSCGKGPGTLSGE